MWRCFDFSGVEILSSTLQEISQTSSHESAVRGSQSFLEIRARVAKDFFDKGGAGCKFTNLSFSSATIQSTQNKFRLTQITCHRSPFYTKDADTIFAIPNLAAGRKGRRRKGFFLLPAPLLRPPSLNCFNVQSIEFSPSRYVGNRRRI